MVLLNDWRAKAWSHTQLLLFNPCPNALGSSGPYHGCCFLLVILLIAAVCVYLPF